MQFFHAPPPTRLHLTAAAAALLLAFPNIAVGATFDAGKKIIWSPGTDALGAPLKPGKGTYDGAIAATAIEPKHGINDQPSKNPIGPKMWDSSKGFTDTGMLKAGGAPHANAESKIDFSATAPKAKSIEGTIAIHGEANAVDAKIHGANMASATASGTMKIEGFEATGFQFKAALDKKVIVDTTIKVNTGDISLKLNAMGVFSDPIFIGFTDVLTGETIESQLFALSAVAEQGGSFDWGSGGVDLGLSGLGSKVSLSLDFPGAWITDPDLIASSLSFTDLGFSATGIFKDLPWVVSANHVTLGPGFLDQLVIPYDIPASLLADDRVYSTSLRFAAAGYVAEAVPEPATWTMLITGFVLSGGVLRRRRSSGPVVGRGGWRLFA